MIKEYKESQRKRIISALFYGFSMAVAAMVVTIFILGRIYAGVNTWAVIAAVSAGGVSWAVYAALTIINTTSVQLYPEELLILRRGKVRYRIPLTKPIETVGFGRKRNKGQYVVADEKLIALHYFSKAEFHLMMDEIQEYQRERSVDYPELGEETETQGFGD